MIRCFGTAAYGPVEPFKLYAPRTMSFGGDPYFYGGPPVQNIAFRLRDGLEATGAAIMGEARVTPAPPTLDPSGELFFAVGGFAELVTITPAGIKREIVCRWPEDTPGQKIDPTAGREAA